MACKKASCSGDLYGVKTHCRGKSKKPRKRRSKTVKRIRITGTKRKAPRRSKRLATLR